MDNKLLYIKFWNEVLVLIFGPMGAKPIWHSIKFGVGTRWDVVFIKNKIPVYRCSARCVSCDAMLARARLDCEPRGPRIGTVKRRGRNGGNGTRQGVLF